MTMAGRILGDFLDFLEENFQEDFITLKTKVL